MPIKIIAHRGASKQAPENTMAAFKLAYQLHADGVETDVHLTKDYIPILIHDDHLKRTTNGTGYIKDLTYNQIKELDAGSWFSKEFVNESIPSLEELLKWIQPKDLLLNIELKNNKIDYKNLENIVLKMINDYQLSDRTTLSTFNVASIKRIDKINNSMEIALITSKKRKNLVQYAKDLNVNALHIKYSLLNRRLIKKCHKENISVRVYTVNKRREMIRCFAYGCDGIFTDVPDKVKKYQDLFPF